MTAWNKKWDYKTCMEESRNYTTRSEFAKRSSSAYDVARRNGWLDEYTWLGESKTSKKWNYETCMEESKKYKTRSDFSKGCSGAYNVARRNGWLDDFTWLELKFHADWTYETCMEESKKYKTRSDFSKGCSGAYNVALKNGWLDDFTWLELKFHADWTYETCMEESKKFKSRSEFQKGSKGAYLAAMRNGWLDEYTWLAPSASAKKWNYETCMEESKKYNTRNEFKKGSNGAYNVARKNGWLDEYTWLKDERFDLYKDNIDSVYVYEFKEFNCAYVGRTLMRCKRKRDIAHIFHADNDAVAKFAKEHNISVPEPIYLEENLTLEDGAKQEEYWLNKYKEDGWTMLNSAKTGSIGALGKGKWNKMTCMEESKKFKSRSEFCKGNGSAYEVARKNGWLDEYTWLELKFHADWTYETCMEESKKFKSRSEFQKGSKGAYLAAIRNGWLDDFFPKCNDLAMAA